MGAFKASACSLMKAVPKSIRWAVIVWLFWVAQSVNDNGRARSDELLLLLNFMYRYPLHQKILMFLGNKAKIMGVLIIKMNIKERQFLIFLALFRLNSSSCHYSQIML